MKPSRRGIGMKGLGLALALGVGLVGCAVLTVDVDVYKGALVNEEHVQLHQLVALTTAAQPMLVHLRDNLEWPDTEGKPPKGATTYPGNYSGECEGKQWKGSWYETGHIKTPEDWVAESPKPWWRAFEETLQEWFGNPLCRPHFKNPYARAVNNVLSLYDDLADSDLAPHARKLRQAVEQLRRATSNPEKDRASYVELAAGFKPDTALTREGLMNLKQGYRELLIASSGSEPSRKVGKLMDALKELSEKQETIENRNELEADLLTKWDGTNTYKGKDDVYDRRLPFRAVWKLLGEGFTDTFLAQVTRKMCKEGATGDRACATLLKRTKELADEYWKSRQAVREIWLESLALLIDIEQLRRDQTKVYDDLKNKVIRLIVEVTNVRHIASALDRLDRDGQCSLLRNSLRPGSFCEVRTDGNLVWSEIKVKDQIGDFEEVLRRNLSSSPADTAHFLLYLDSLESTAPLKNGVANLLVEAANKANPQRIVRLGLNRSFIEDRKLEGSPELFDFVDDVSRKVAQGFARGRLQDGLHTLTEAFLKSHNGNADTEDSHEEKKLLDALVEFAQKLLFLANHEGLSSPPGTSGLILGGAEKINRGLFGDSLTDAGLYGIFGSGLAENRKQQYVRVLQAVGNSILFSANELRERERYREQGQKKVPAEVMAARSVYSPDPEKVITDLLTELEHDKQAAQIGLDNASDRKKKVEREIGSATAPKTGLYDEEDKAANEVSKAEADLKGYLRSLNTLEAIHGILTADVIKQVKSQWQAGNPDPKDEEEFLNGTDGHSLKKKLENVRQSLNGTPNQEVVKRWTDAVQRVDDGETRKAFEAYRALKGLSSLKRLELFDAFVVHIKELEAERVKQAAQYESTHNEKQAKLDRITQKIDTLKKEMTALDTQITNTLPQDKADFETAKTEIESVKATVLKEAVGSREFASPEAVYMLVSSHLQKANTSSGKTAQRILSSRTPPPGVPPLNPDNYKSPREVMDTVIALLRHRHMAAVERFGKDSPEEKKATEALHNAYRHRAGMIYIRPSSAYLRTSFPSTSLQDDPNLAWDNMLLKQGLRNLPFSSELRDILDPSVKQDRTLTSELDKQYWQNINRVRVSGTGFTNQALVKDDVGNWYVKQYFGDTERIWESAKNLALFSMSTKVPIDLAKQLNKASTPEEYAENNKETPTLQKVLEKHQGAYKTNTDEVKAKLERLHDKELKETLIAAWDAHKDLKDDATFNAELKQSLEAEIVVWKEVTTTLKKKADQDPGQAIVKDVGALSRLGRMLSASVTKISSSDITQDIMQEEKELEEKQKKLAEEQDKEKKNREEAKLEVEKEKLEAKKKAKLEKKRKMAVFEVHKVVGGRVTDILTDRNRVLDQYEQAIVFIGDAANPKEAKQSN
jgi:hypothetical protein